MSIKRLNYVILHPAIILSRDCPVMSHLLLEMYDIPEDYPGG